MTAAPPSQLKPNPHWARLPLFDRKGWKTVRFGEVVRMLKEQTDPVADGVERYVAGEHMETENVHIGQWGNVGDGYLGPAFIRRFRKGQVLYGSRRTYLKKVAVAEWDGVTANTTFVLEAVEGKLLQELLPWLMLSERFTKHSIQESKGSTNPYINFPDIAKFEFALPPLDQQRRIAEILWALDESVVSHDEVGQDLEALRTSLTAAALRGTAEVSRSNGAPWSSWPITRVEDVCERISVGIVITPSKYYRPTGVRCFRSANVRRGFIEDNDWIFISEEAHQMHAKSILRAGDVLVVRSGVFAGMSCIVPPEHDGVNCIDVVFATPRREVLEPEWLSNFINSSFGQVEIKRGERGLAQKHFGVDAMRNMPLPLPPLTEQRRHLARLKEVSNATALNQKHLENLRSTSIALVTHLFQ